MRDVSQIRLKLVAEQLTGEWRATPEIARALGVEWTPGSHGDLDEVRDDLFRLNLQGHADFDPRQNGHMWKRPSTTPEESE